MARPVIHFEVIGDDGGQTREFYSKLFDWEIQMWEGGDYGLVAAAGEKGCIGGGIGGAPEGTDPYATFYVEVDDLKAYLDKAVSMGGEIVMPPMEIPNVGSSALFRDPSGLLIGLFKGMEQ